MFTGQQWSISNFVSIFDFCTIHRNLGRTIDSDGKSSNARIASVDIKMSFSSGYNIFETRTVDRNDSRVSHIFSDFYPQRWSRNMVPIEFNMNAMDSVFARKESYRGFFWIYDLNETIILNTRWRNDLRKNIRMRLEINIISIWITNGVRVSLRRHVATPKSLI